MFSKLALKKSSMIRGRLFHRKNDKSERLVRKKYSERPSAKNNTTKLPFRRNSESLKTCLNDIIYIRPYKTAHATSTHFKSCLA